MDTGTYISGAGHLGLIGFLLVGNIFASEPLPMEVTEVSVISQSQFEAMMAAQQNPAATIEVALPDAPQTSAAETEIPAETQPPVQAKPPEVTAAPEPETVPDVPSRAPEPDVSETAPVLDQPSQDIAVLVPETGQDAVPEQSDRVAPQPVAQPDPDARPDDIQRDAVRDDAAGEAEQEPQEATAPEEAAPEIVTEADEPSAAPQTSLRPPARRPSPPTRTAENTPADEAPGTDATDDVAAAIAGAVAEAQASDTPAAPSGPPLTGSEREGLRVAVSSCWNVGALSSEAQETKVTVYVAMNRDGTPDTGSIRMIGSSGGSDAAAKRVFDTARRAIIRCGARGFPLPVEKYGQWREIEMTFNPEGMFWR